MQLRVHTIVVSTQHDEVIDDSTHPDLSIAEREQMMLERVRSDVINQLVPLAVPADYLDKDTIYHVNPTGQGASWRLHEFE